MKHSLLLLALAVLPLLTACSEEDALHPGLPGFDQLADDSQGEEFTESFFPEDDGAIKLTADPAIAFRVLMLRTDPTRTLTPGQTKIEDAQFEEIKTFVTNNLKGDTQLKTYMNIYQWIHDNVEYAYSGTAYLDPYDVFIHKRCVCQGFANLLKIMCQTQEIPACVVNGYLSTIGGHAWNYVYCDNAWRVSDPTNYQEFAMTDINAYKQKLIPQIADFDLYEDEQFTYGFFDREWCVTGIKQNGKNYVAVPWSANGVKVTMFHPLSEVHANYNTLYLGKNIRSLGVEPQMNNVYFPTLSQLYVDPGNTIFESYKNVLYYKGSVTPYFIPNATKSIELKPMEIVDKNTIYNLPEVEEVIVPDGTKRIEAYAFEACPKLQTIYVSEDVEYIDPQAIYNCHPDCKIIRTPTGINEVRK